MQLYKASEDYLEAILILREKNGTVRSVDVAEFLGVSRPSVSYATHRLRDAGYIAMENNGPVYLTPEGEAVAQRIYERHRVLTDGLCRLGIDPELAREDACRIEHDISDDTFEALKRHLAKFGS